MYESVVASGLCVPLLVCGIHDGCCVDHYLKGCMLVWLYGCVVVWLYDCVFVWLYGCVWYGCMIMVLVPWLGSLVLWANCSVACGFVVEQQSELK